ncbi:MAG: hypothetical protein WBG65_05515 [Sulfurimonadaceae bacterium]
MSFDRGYVTFYDVAFSATLHYALEFYLLARSRNAFDDVSHNVYGSSPKKAKQFAFS